MKHKKLFIAATAVLSVIIFLATFLLIWFFGDVYRDFDNYFRKEFGIAGLDDGAVPQGLGTCNVSYDYIGEDGKTSTKTQQFFFESAYMVDGSPSRIYVTGADDGYIGYVTMKLEDGSDYKGHCGGIAVNGSTLWISSDGIVYVARSSSSANIAREIYEKAKISRNPVETAEDGSQTEKDFSIKFTSSFKANCNASFLYYYDDSRYSSTTYDRLYVGEFYRKGNYETAKNHRWETPGKYKNTAFMYEYNVSSSSDSKYGLVTLSDEGLTEENQVPKIQKIYSIPEKIQGAAFSGRKGYGTYSDGQGGILVLSQSYGLANSHLLCFDWEKVNNNSNSASYSNLAGTSFEYDGVTKTVGGKTIAYTDSSLKVYYVDKGNSEIFVNDYSIPSMSEGMCVVTPAGANNTASFRIYVLFESAGKKYNKFVRERVPDVYSFIPHKK